jgi:hypothetical protein
MAKKTAASGKTITEPIYYITNQYNLREILSGGFIGPKASFDDKYYPDLLEASPGRIPLFTQTIYPSLIQQVNSHDPETSFAVVLQIDPAKTEAGLPEEIKMDGNASPAVLVYSGAISFKSVSAIHFLSAANLSEFEVRSYSNMPSPRKLYKVSPELTGTTINDPGILQEIRDLPPLSRPTPADFSLLDRISGAVSLCISHSLTGNDQTKQLINLIDPPKKQKSADKLPAWFSLGLNPKSPEEIAGLTDINELVFASTLTVLHGYNLKTVGQKPKILEEIKQLIYSQQSIGEEHKATLEKSFIKIQRLLQLQDEFEPFKPSPTGYDAIRGLLLFLMRPQHKELLSWSMTETNASQPAMLTALAYSGTVIGRKGLEMEYRTADMDISEEIVALLNKIAKKNKVEPAPAKVTTGKKTKTQPAITMTRAAISVAGRFVAPSLVDWKTIPEMVLNEKKDDPEFIGSAVWLCRKKGWADCVRTVVTWTVKENFQLQSGQKNELTLRLAGFPDIAYELDFEQFKIKIATTIKTNTL